MCYVITMSQTRKQIEANRELVNHIVDSIQLLYRVKSRPKAHKFYKICRNKGMTIFEVVELLETNKKLGNFNELFKLVLTK